MRGFLDACVLYPPVMREALLAAARQGLFEPLWSESVLAEWQHVAARDGAVNAAMVQGEIALLNTQWHAARVADPGPSPDLWLPDSGDIHVLAGARAGKADVLVTMNLKDFPRREMEEQGIAAVHPDAFLKRFCDDEPDRMAAALRDLNQQASKIAGGAIDLAKALKKARLPRVGKFWRMLNQAKTSRS